MSFKKTLLGLFAALALGVSTANAGFLIEPYLGYKFSTGGEYDNTSAQKEELSYSGPAYGARLGYTFLGFMAGIDYSLSSFDAEITYTDGTKTTDAMDQSTMGIFVGYDFPILLRAWATYYLSSELEDTNSTGSFGQGDTWDGGGYALGVGFTGLPFVSLNLEYRALTYDEWTDTSANNTITTREITANEILLSVSLPLDL